MHMVDVYDLKSVIYTPIWLLLIKKVCVCLHTNHRVGSVHAYTYERSECIAHTYDRLVCAHTYTEGLSVCTCIWYVWVCAHIHMTGLSVCVCTSQAQVTSSRGHVLCCTERLLIVSVWFGLKMCTATVLPRGKKPWVLSTCAKPGSVLSYTGKALKTLPLSLQARLRWTSGSVLAQETGRQSSKWLRRDV